MQKNLKLNDLMSRERNTSRLMNVKIPAYVSDAIEQVAKEVQASKTEVVIALLNEGLILSEGTLKDWRSKASTRPARR